MTIFLILAAVLILAGLAIRGFTHAKDTLARLPIPDYDGRYQGGDELCDVCGEPSMYYLGGRCVHYWCRDGSRVLKP